MNLRSTTAAAGLLAAGFAVLVVPAAVPASASSADDVTPPNGRAHFGTDGTPWPGEPVYVQTYDVSDDVTPSAAVNRTVDWGDGVVDTLPAGTSRGTHAYRTAGTYWVTVRFTDEAGNSVTRGAPPVLDSQGGAVVVREPTYSLKLNKRSAWLNGAPIVVTGTGLSPDIGGVTMVPGDGSSFDMILPDPPLRFSRALNYSRPGTFPIVVRLRGEYGFVKSVPVGTVTITRDTFKPAVTLTAPGKPRTATSYRTLRGTASDKGLGLDDVRVKLVQKRGSRWHSYGLINGKLGWAGQRSKAVALQRAANCVVSLKSGKWTFPVKGITKGELVIVYEAWDKGGLRTAKTYRVVINRTR